MRVKYDEKRITPARLEVIRQANAILAEYQQQGLALTLRQLYYQFVARGLDPEPADPSTSASGTASQDARMAGWMDWESTSSTGPAPPVGAPWDDPWRRSSGRRSRQFNQRPVGRAAPALRGLDREGRRRRRDRGRSATRQQTSRTSPAVATPRTPRCGRPASGSGATSERAQNVNPPHRRPRPLGARHDPRHRGSPGAVPDPGSLQRSSGRRPGQGVSGLRGRPLRGHPHCADDGADPAVRPPAEPGEAHRLTGAGYVEEYGYDSWELDALEPSVIAALIEDEVTTWRDDTLWDDAVEEEERQKGLPAKPRLVGPRSRRSSRKESRHGSEDTRRPGGTPRTRGHPLAATHPAERDHADGEPGFPAPVKVLLDGTRLWDEGKVRQWNEARAA